MPAGERAIRRLVRSAAFAFSPAQLDDDRLQRPPRTAVDGNDLARRRRRIAHARGLLVLEQHLAATDIVSHRDAHRGAQPDRIGSYHRRVARRGGLLDLLFRRTGKRQPETLLERMQTHLRASG